MYEVSDKCKEACGIFGVYAPGEDVARLTFFGLYALQHRGQESAGIATTGKHGVRIHKAMGLVSQVFNEDILKNLDGDMAIGHNRYSTTGSSRVLNAQPFLVETALGPLALGHNGNLTNAIALRNELLRRGVGLSTSSDTEIIVQLLAGAEGDTWEERIRELMHCAQGAYTLILLTQRAIYAVRDPWGFRPLCLGRMNGTGWVAASETCALATIGAEFVCEVQPGEIVRLDADGITCTQGAPPATRQALCVFEYVYFSRPDSLLAGRAIHQVRRRLGANLAREHPVEADMVMGVPDSATAHAIGYAHAAGIPYGEGLIKNRYIGRTFIQPDDRLRRLGVALKFNPLPDSLQGKRIVLVDDSIVRGNTSGPIVAMLRQAGAAEVHLRVASPPLRHPCFMGVDMATREELIAHRLTVAQIGRHLGVDSIAYLSLKGLVESVAQDATALCMACFDGCYPVTINADEEVCKTAMEIACTC